MKISVAFIVYNGVNYMNTQLDSILAQTRKVDEIVVVEDASLDNTKEILQEYENKYPLLFSIHYNSENYGSYKSIDKAIKACTGDIIILSDHDDFWESNKVESILKYFKENPKMEGLMTNGFLIDAEGEINTNYFLWDSMSFPYKNITNNEELKKYINTVENCATGATMAIRNNLPILNGGFPFIKNMVHDRWLAINLAEKNTLGILDEKLIRYRLHPGQETGGRKKEIDEYIKINNDIFLENTDIGSFKFLRYIINKIEWNLYIQNEIKKIPNLGFDNQKYIDILKNKHAIFIKIGFKKWPILSSIRKVKKILIPTIASQ
jgi:glycosyltransferase involved in cell wall biosynthesis